MATESVSHWKIALLVLGLTATAALGFLPRLGEIQFRHEEPRRATVARSMLEGANPLLGSFSGRPYVAKPPGHPWLIAATSLMADGEVTETTARLPSVLALWGLAILLVLSTGGVLGWHGRVAVGFGCLLCYHLARKATLAEIELPFTLLVTASLWLWYLLDRSPRARPTVTWVIGGALAGLAFLVKREPGLVFFWLGVSGYLLWRGRARELLTRPALVGLAVSMAVAAPWPIAVIATVGFDGWWQSLRLEVLGRGAPSDPFELARHMALYPFAVLVGVLPFGALLPLLAHRQTRRRLRTDQGEALAFVLCVLAFNFPLYWLRGDVALRYVMPLYGFLLLLAAMLIDAMPLRPRALLPALIALGLAGRIAHFAVALPVEQRRLETSGNALTALAALDEARDPEHALLVLSRLPSALPFYASPGTLAYLAEPDAALPAEGERFVFDPKRRKAPLEDGAWREVSRVPFKNTVLVVGESVAK